MAATRTAAAPTATPEEMVGADAVERVASELVASGRVVPGLTVEAGEARSWWWPLPSAGQRAAIAALVAEPSPDTQRSVADALAVAVDAAVRSQLTAAGVELAARRPGRPTAVAAWLRSLTGADPRLPASLDPAKVRALAEAVQAWVRSGTHLGGRARLCLRVHEPARQGADWRVELLVQDRQETSLLAPLPAVLDHGGPFGAAVVWDVVGSIGRLPRLAPELAGALEEAAPSEIPLGDADALRLLRERAAALDDAGIALLVPAWWSNRPRLGLRARATRSSSTSSTSAGLGMDALVDLDWEVALGATRLTKRDLETLRRAAEAKRSLVRIRGQWVEIDPAEVVELIEAAGTGGVTTAGELLRVGLGVGELDAPGDAAVVGVDARAVPWLASLLDDALHATVEPLAPRSW